MADDTGKAVSVFMLGYNEENCTEPCFKVEALHAYGQPFEILFEASRLKVMEML